MQLDWALTERYQAERLIRQQEVGSSFQANAAPYIEAAASSDPDSISAGNALGELSDFFKATEQESSRRALVPMGPFATRSVLGLVVATMSEVVQDGPTPRPGFRTLSVVHLPDAVEPTVVSYRAFAPDLTINPFTPVDRARGNLMRNDVTVTSLPTLMSTPERQTVELIGNTDLVVLEDMHGSLPPRIRDSLILLGTTSFVIVDDPASRQAERLRRELGIEHELSPIDQRQATQDLGIANGLMLYAVNSGVATGEGGVSTLANSSTRNGLLVGAAYDMIRRGNHGVVQSQPSRSGAHARMLVEKFSELGFVDPANGVGRQVKAAAVGNFRRDDSNSQIMADFAGGEYDVLVFDKLPSPNKSNLPALDFMIIDPSLSEGDMARLTGHAARFNDRPTAIFTMIDQYARRRKTPWDTMGLESILSQGYAVTGTPMRPPSQPKLPNPKPAADREKPPRPELTEAQKFMKMFSGPVREAMAAARSGEILDSTLVDRYYRTPPPDYVPVRTADVVRDKLVTNKGAVEGLGHHIAEDGRPLRVRVAEGTRVAAYMLLPFAQEFLNDRYREKRDSWVSNEQLEAFFVDAGWPVPSYDLMMRAASLANVDKKVLKRVMYYDGPGTRRMLDYFRQIPLLDANVELPLAVLETIGPWKRGNKVSEAIKKNWDTFGEHMNVRRRGLPGKGLKPVDTVAIEKTPDLLMAAAELSPALREYLAEQGVERLMKEAKEGHGLPPGVSVLLGGTDIKHLPQMLKGDGLDTELREYLEKYGVKGLISAAKEEWLAEFRERRLKVWLSATAINEFLAPFEASERQEQQQKAEQQTDDNLGNIESISDTEDERPEEKRPVIDAPAPLDASYVLSSYGDDWSEHTECDPADLKFFFPRTISAARQAKATCKDCPVKGDCLLDALEADSDELAGGFMQQERAGMDKGALVAWLLGTRSETA